MSSQGSLEPVVVTSILERSAEATLAAASEVPAGSALVEIRGDHLRAPELADVLRRLGPATIASVRRQVEGGAFEGTEEERRASLTSALEAGAGFIDVEWNSPLRSLARGPAARRTILSHHGAPCRAAELAALYGAMRGEPAARLKIVPVAETPVETKAVREILATAAHEGRALAAFAQGVPGAVSRLLAPSWGSWASYGSCRPGAATAAGQPTAADLVEIHDVLGIRDSTRRFALVGSAVSRSPSPAMHRAAHREAGLDARYFALELADFRDCLSLVGPEGIAGLAGLGVTRPFKEDAAGHSRLADPVAQASRAVNTLRIEGGGFSGHNTDGPAMLELVARRLHPHGARVAVVGAGGTARAAAVVFRAAGAEVCLFNRSLPRATGVARALGVGAQALTRLAESDWDVLIQATPLGEGGEAWLPPSCLRGRVVLDAVYAVETPLIRDARTRGLSAIDGFELLVAQAVLQFELLCGVRPQPATLERAGRSWLARHPAAS